MLDLVDEMIIGGGMATTFLKEIYNINIGDSMYDEEGAQLVPEIVAKAYKNQVRLDFPIDFVCGDSFSETANVKKFTLQTGIPNGWMKLDTGYNTFRLYREAVRRAQTIVWNGPMGVFEFDKFRHESSAIINSNYRIKVINVRVLCY